MIESKNAGNLPEARAQAIRTTATAAAARITSAYSAVVCPASSASLRPARTCMARTYQDNSIPVHLLSGDRTHGGEEDGNHRGEEERGEDEEHQWEQHLHGRRSGALGGGGTPNLTDIGGEPRDLLRQRGPNRLGPSKRADQSVEVGQVEPLARGLQLDPPSATQIRRVDDPVKAIGERTFGAFDRAPEGELWRQARRGRHGE